MGDRRRKLRAQLKKLNHKDLKAAVPREELGNTTDRGSFTYGYCKSCEWQGGGRRARDKARRDALEHAAFCTSKGKGKIRIATCDTKVS